MQGHENPCIFATFRYFSSRPQHRKTAMLQNKTAGFICSDSYLLCVSSSVKVKMSFGVQDKILAQFFDSRCGNILVVPELLHSSVVDAIVDEIILRYIPFFHCYP